MSEKCCDMSNKRNNKKPGNPLTFNCTDGGKKCLEKCSLCAKSGYNHTNFKNNGLKYDIHAK